MCVWTDGQSQPSAVSVSESETRHTHTRRQPHSEYCCMAFEGQSRRLLQIDQIRVGPLVPMSCRGSLSSGPKNTQLSQKAQPEHRRTRLLWPHQSFTSHFSGSVHFSFPVHFLSHHSQFAFFFSPFFSLASVSAVEPVAVTGLHVMTTSFFISCHILMSWHSNILASVFFTLRAVRREAGLLAQHSDMSLPICRKHCRQK